MVKMNLLNVLTVIFVVLKLVGTISWSWFWVLSPTIIPVIGWLVIVVLAILCELNNK